MSKSILEKHNWYNNVFSTWFIPETNKASVKGINYLNLSSPGIQCRNYADSAWSGISASGFHTQSSRRYKENISPITDDRAKKILDVDVVTYDYKDNIVSENQYDRTGVIVEDTVDTIPEVVSYREIDGKMVPDGVDYAKFVPYLIRMVQLQQEEIENLKVFLQH